MSGKLIFEASERNKEPILQVFKKIIPEKFKNKNSVSVLEIGSGSGQHAVYFCKEFTELLWQPSDIDKRHINSIKAYIEDSNLPNLKEPVELDIAEGDISTKIDKEYDMMIAINLIHISPWKCTEGLFQFAGNLLSPFGILVTYGPYSFHGQITPDSNVQFNNYLKSKNVEWGLRDIDDLEKEAKKYGLYLDLVFDMPANNKTLVWCRHSLRQA